MIQSTPAEPTVFLIDDDQSSRESMAYMLRANGFAVTEFPSAKRFLDWFDEFELGCVVLDVNMPGIDGLELQRIMLKRNIRSPIIFISGDADIPMATKALRAGALDLLEKPVNTKTLVARIRDAFEMVMTIQKESALRRNFLAMLEKLTNKEREVLPAIYAGHSLKQIASAFGVTLATASRHQSRIFEKLEINSLAQLIRLVDSANFDIGGREQAS